MAITTQMRTDVSGLYVALFGRAPDSEGLGYWVQQLDQGQTLANIADAMYATAPARAYYPAYLTNQEIIGNFYTNVLGRAADAEGLAYWTGKLNEPGATPGSVIAEMINVVSTYDGTDADGIKSAALFQNKVTVAQWYGEHIGAIDGSSDVLALVTEDPASVAEAEAAATAPSGPATNLTVAQDTLTGTAGADTFVAKVVQNANGEQTNQLATGDEINGGAGTDVLNAKVQTATALGAYFPTSEIVPETKDVEVVNFTALNAQNGYYGGYYGWSTVGINAKDMLGLDKVGSINSDASLFVTNLTTLTDTGNYADRRNTDSITLRMDHSAPDMGNPDLTEYGAASSMTVLFDNDYLLSDASTTSTLELRMVNAYSLAQENKPLVGFTKVAFLYGDQTVSVDVTQAMRDATAQQGYTLLAQAVADKLAEMGITGVTVNVLAQRDAIFTDDVGNYNQGENAGFYTPILVTSTTGPLARGETTTDNTTVNANFLNTQTPTESSQDNPVTSNIELFKVGRGAEGGHLTVGGMSTDGANVWDYSSTAIKEGVEAFNVKVLGDQTQMSSLASLQSTNNTLAQVKVTWETNSLADLIIGNHNTTDTSINNINGAKGVGLTTTENAALKDVRVFDAANNNSATLANGTVVTNDVEVHAYLSDEVVPKYMDRTDTVDDALLDNANFQYTFGAGNDLLNMNISKTNLEASGTTNREDFSFTATMGSGDDHVQVQIGNGAGVVTDAWYINSKIDNNLAINAGAGADTVETWGAGAWNVNLGDGNDVIYNDNSGIKGVWVFNTSDQQLLPNGLTDLVSGANDKHAFYMANVTVNLNGVSKTVQINSYSSTDTGLNNAIKNAINNDIYLSKLLVAEDGPGATLVVHSLVDGNQADSALQIDVAASTLANMSPSQIAAFNAANGTSCVTTADVQTVVNASVAAWTTQNDGVFGAPGNHVNDYFAGLLGTGTASANATASVITDGTGQDVIVLSTSGLDKETVNLTADGQSDLIYNVTNATINGLQLNDVIVTSAGTHYTAMLGTATFSGVTATTSTIVGSAGADTIHGLDGVAETIDAGAGNDTVYVSSGSTAPSNDAITLGAGSDTLVFNTLLATGTGPTIADYSVADDSIQISKTAFAGLGAVGALTAGEFALATDPVTATTRLIYDVGTGDLSYDADGSAGGAAVVIATFTGMPALTAAEFTIVA